MPNDPGILSSLLNAFIAVFSTGFTNILPSARWLLQTLAIIEIGLAGIWWAFNQEDAIIGLIERSLRIGFFIFLVLDFPNLVEIVRDGFVFAGLLAGGSRINVAEFTNPSRIAAFGTVAVQPVFDHIQSYGTVAALRNFGDLIMTGLAGLLILLAFYIIAIQVFITILEFYLIAVVGLLLVPFGVNRHTSFLAERVFGAVISMGVKLMVLSFIASATLPVLVQLQIPPDPTLNQIMTLLLGSLAIAALTWHGPAIAAGLMAGTPSLSAGTAASTAIAGGFALAAGGAAGHQALQAGRAGASAAMSGARAATRIGSGVSTAASLGAATTVGGRMAQLGGAAKGVGSFAMQSGKDALNNRVGHGFRAAAHEGRIKGFSRTGGSFPSGGGGFASGGGSSGRALAMAGGGGSQAGGSGRSMGGGGGDQIISAKPPGPVMANKNSGIYHSPSDHNYGDVNPHNQIFFSNADQAEQAGYRPAQNIHYGQGKDIPRGYTERG